MSHLKEKLMSIISDLPDGGLAYQRIDELFEVIDSVTKHEIINSIDKSFEIRIVKEDDIHDCGFNDLVSWYQKSDTLFLVDKELLICLSEENSKLVL